MKRLPRMNKEEKIENINKFTALIKAPSGRKKDRLRVFRGKRKDINGSIT